MKGGGVQGGHHTKQKAPHVIEICPCHTLKMYSFLTPSPDGGGQLHDLVWSFYLWQRTPVPTEHEAGRAQGLSGLSGKGLKNLLL